MNGSPTLTVASDMKDLWHSNKEKGVCHRWLSSTDPQPANSVSAVRS